MKLSTTASNSNIVLCPSTHVAINENEALVQSLLGDLHNHFLEKAGYYFRKQVGTLQFTATQTNASAGVSGTVLVSDVYYTTELGEGRERIAVKYYQDKEGAFNEIRNAMDLEMRFRSTPKFGIPRVVFASSQEPIMLVYEGVNGTNYDEIQVDGQAYLAGRLLAIIHGTDTRPVDQDTYRDLARLMGEQLAAVGKEKELSHGLSESFSRMRDALSGCNPFSDFHQSNVMISESDGTIQKMYVIDPEYMQKGSFDRMEDAGIFFGKQLLDEYLTTLATGTPSLTKGLIDINDFLQGYDDQIFNDGGMHLEHIYPNGNPLAFFIAQWGIMDVLDKLMTYDIPLDTPESMAQIGFVIYLLNSVDFSFQSNRNY